MAGQGSANAAYYAQWHSNPYLWGPPPLSFRNNFLPGMGTFNVTIEHPDGTSPLGSHVRVTFIPTRLSEQSHLGEKCGHGAAIAA